MELVTPPVGPVVDIDDLKAHLRVDHSDEDAQITALEAAAVAYLDGWGGVLGRAIKAQTWRMEVSAWGEYSLPLPDISAVAVTYLDALNAEQPATSVELREVDGRTFAEIDGPPADRIFINMTAAMSARYLPTAQIIVKLIVAAWYDDRAADIPPAAHALINSIRSIRT